MQIETVLDGSGSRSAGHCEVSFDRNDPGSIGYFSIESLRTALDIFEAHAENEGVYVRFGTASYKNDRDDHDTLMAFLEDESNSVATVCCPRKTDEEIREEFVNQDAEEEFASQNAETNNTEEAET